MATILFGVSDLAFSWSIETHEEMTNRAIGISQLENYGQNNLGIPLSTKGFKGLVHSKNIIFLEEFHRLYEYTAAEWIKHGAGAEDEFADAIRHSIVYGSNQRFINHFYNPFWNNRDIYPYPFPDFAEPGSEEDWSFQQGGLYDFLIPTFGPLFVEGKPSPRWIYDGCPISPVPRKNYIRDVSTVFFQRIEALVSILRFESARF